MGRKGNWFSSVKKAFSPDSQNKKNKRGSKSKNSVENERSLNPEISTLETVSTPQHLPLPPEVQRTEVVDEQAKYDYSVEDANTSSYVPAVEAPEVVGEVVRPIPVTRFTGMSREEVAAIKIQTTFRGYLARRALRALRGLVRLKSLVEGATVKRQTTNTLRSMQGISRVQSQINNRRIRMTEENQALQRQLLQERAKELESLQMGEDWNDSAQSKEQIEAKLLSKYEATMRRERAMAYSFSHQQTWKKSARTTNLLFIDPTNPQWGWSWMERWMAARPESKTEKEATNGHFSVKGASPNFAGNEIAKSFARHQLNSDKPLPPSNRKLSSPSNLQSPSIPSSKSEQNRRHSIAGSSVRDDESLASSPSVPGYMAATRSAKAKSRMQSPLGMENGTPEKGPAGYAKKRLSFPASPARPRRHSGPPRLDSTSIADNMNDIPVN
ncbi:Protein IQ-DOMAIN 1 [Heracleum sosnowskyi]|uniref:Protein IQ-DOMAIN 1 n=1 Tax=Heracleum sosnowskyi TaxID=360622 RepID=A0AAD8N6H8_9APIA|nr:Protein IQ-DOMAIN 1 [Heracleum sosnowskyi]